MNEAVLVLANVYFQSCTLNVNKIDVILCFRKLIYAFSLTCFKVRIYKISDKSDTFSLNYSNFFRGPLFFGTQCSYRTVLGPTKYQCSVSAIHFPVKWHPICRNSMWITWRSFRGFFVIFLFCFMQWLSWLSVSLRVRVMYYVVSHLLFLAEWYNDTSCYCVCLQCCVCVCRQCARGGGRQPAARGTVPVPGGCVHTQGWRWEKPTKENTHEGSRCKNNLSWTFDSVHT